MKLTLRQFFHQQLHGHFQGKVVPSSNGRYGGAHTIGRAFLEYKILEEADLEGLEYLLLPVDPAKLLRSGNLYQTDQAGQQQYILLGKDRELSELSGFLQYKLLCIESARPEEVGRGKSVSGEALLRGTYPEYTPIGYVA